MPTFPLGSQPTQQQQDWLHTALEAAVTSSIAYVRVYAVVPQLELEVSTQLLKAGLGLLGLVQKLIVAVPSGQTRVPEPGLAALLMPTPRKSAGAPVQLLQALRSELLPPLALRNARVEDHDDMQLVMQHAEQR